MRKPVLLRLDKLFWYACAQVPAVLLGLHKLVLDKEMDLKDDLNMNEIGNFTL
jgi:hypothetical protein